MKNFLFALTMATASLCASAQSDPIVMRINNKPVTRSEFEYNFNKNNSEGVVDKKNIEEYVPLFVNYKLKVEAALDAKLDTLSSFQKEFRHYRDQQVRPLLVPQGAMESECLQYYNRVKASLGGKQLLKPAHIFLRVKQMDNAQEMASQKQRIDSVFQALIAGADFAQLAKSVSEDRQSAMRGGSLSWIGPNQTLKEFEDVAYSMQVGAISEPFLSTVGYHIIKLEDKKDLEPFEELKPNIQRFLERQGMEDKLAADVLDQKVADSNGEKTVEQILDEETERLCQSDNDLKYLVQEYHDGLLLFEECTREVWEPASKDTAAIVNYFQTNRSAYAWAEPHFRGMIYYCREKSDVKNVKKLLKNVPMADWTRTLREKMNKDSVMVRSERRLFANGDNSNVDAFVLKDKTAKANVVEGFPYMGYMGKVLKKGPETWLDVKQQVVSDYQRSCEDKFVEELRKKYPVEIYQDVLQTVNNH